MNIYAFLSNLVLAIHFAFVAFIVLGLVTIWIGHWRGWAFVRNFYFRMAHLLAMAIVVVESLVGMICPLTAWEYELRLRAGQASGVQDSFIQYWVSRVLFYEFDEHVFTIAYVTVFGLMLLTLWLVPPRKRRSPRPGQ